MIKKGFTLIELLVVITILAILAGAALPYVQSYVAESRIAKAKTDLEEIARALAVYETREGDYQQSDVSDLTGRYLNKAPIDPWGNGYVVDINAGSVYSKGPDRVSGLPADKYDDIVVPYQPPLALVSVKWIDKNQSGAVDVQNVPDQFQLTFSRKLKRVVADTITANLNAWLVIDPDGSGLLPEEDIQTNFVQSFDEGGLYPPVILTDKKTIVLSLKDAYNPVANPISLGTAFVRIRAPIGPDGIVSPGVDDLCDNADNLCLTDQNVLVLAQ